MRELCEFYLVSHNTLTIRTMSTNDFNAAALQIIHDDFRVAFRFDAHVVTAIHSAFSSFVDLSVNLNQISSCPRHDESHYEREIK